MEIKIFKETGKTVVKVAGRLDIVNSAEFDSQMRALLAEAVSEIVVECQEIEYVSSSGLRVFLAMQKHMSAHGGKLTLRAMRPEIREVFDMTGFSTIIHIE